MGACEYELGATDARLCLDELAALGTTGRIALSLDGSASPDYLAGVASVLGYEPIVILAPRTQ